MNWVAESCNFIQYRPPKREKLEKIANCISKHPEGIQPKRIALETKLRHNTIKSYLKIICKEGFAKVRSGWYYPVAERTHGDEKPIRTHNVNLSINDVSLDKKYEDKIEEFDSVKILVRFGVCNSKITGVISGEPPLNYREFCFAVDKFKSMICSSIGVNFSNEDILVTSCEFNADYENLRIEGINAVTLTDFKGNLLKLYNKENNLRKEARETSLPLPAVLSFLRGNAVPYNVVERQIALEEKVDEMSEVVRCQNRESVQINSLLSAILDKLNNISNKNTITKEIILRQTENHPINFQDSSFKMNNLKEEFK